jgi:hypothetical protein
VTAGAHFQINQAANGIPTGTTDVARNDIRYGSTAHLVGDSSSGQTSPVWLILAWPPGSARNQPTNRTTFDATCGTTVLDVPGSYLVDYVVGDGSGTINATNSNHRQFIIRCTQDPNGLIVDDGIAEPAFGELVTHDNSAGNDRGYAKVFEQGMAAQVPAVSTVAALRNRRPSKHKHVHLLGYYAPGDSDVRSVYWDSASTAPDDGGHCFQPGFGTGAAMATGRWIARRSGKVPATDYGAKADVRAVTDAAITAGSAILASTAAAWTSADVGKTIVLNDAMTNTLTGTVSTTAGSRDVVGSGTTFERDLYLGAHITIGSTAYTVGRSISNGVPDFFLTGTVEVTGGTSLVGTGTKFSTELYVGCVVGIFGGTVVSSSDIPVPFLARVLTVTDNTHATITLHNTGNGEGVSQHITGSTILRWWYGDSTDMGGGARAAQTRIIVDPAPSGTALGLTIKGPPKPLVAKILSVAGNNATLDTTAQVTVTAGLCHIGTDCLPAFTAAKDNHDHITVPPAVLGARKNSSDNGFTVSLGSYLLAGSFTIEADRKGCTVEWASGASWYVTDTVKINGTYNKLVGNWNGFGFGGGEGPSFGTPVTITYLGRHSQPIVQMAADPAHTCVGSGVYGVAVRQRCHVDVTNDEFGAGQVSGRTGGVTGFMFGPYGVTGQSAIAGAAVKKIAAIDCYHGVIVTGGSQTYSIEDVDVVRYNNGWVGAYSQGIGIGIGVSSDYRGGAACTAGLVTGHVLIQGNRIGGQIGNMYTDGPYVGTTDFSGKWVVENLPEIFSAYFVFAGCGKCSLLDNTHDENETQPQRDAVLPEHAGPDGYSFVCVQLGAPTAATGQGLAQEITIRGQYLNGATSAIAAYSWDTFIIDGNHIDNQGAAQNANIKSAIFRNFGGGAGRSRGVWRTQLKPGGGSYNTATDIYPSTYGVDHEESWNPDSAGAPHPVYRRTGTGQFDKSISPLYAGTKVIADETDLDGTVHYGDDAETTVAVDSASGQPVLNAASVATGIIKVGQRLTINEGGPRAEDVTVQSISANAITCTTNLVNTHTAAQADTIRHAISNFVAKRAAYEWDVPPGGFGYTIKTDGATIQHHYLLPATSGAPDRFVGLSFTSSVWDTSGTPQARDITFAISSERVGTVGKARSFFNHKGLRVWEAQDDGAFTVGPTGGGGFNMRYGGASPESVVTEVPGALYTDTTNGELYIKVTGTGNTGWKKMTHA